MLNQSHYRLKIYFVNHIHCIVIDKGLNIEAAIPGLSFTPINVIFASFLVEDTPVIILLFKIFTFGN